MLKATGRESEDIAFLNGFFGEAYGDLNHGCLCILVEDEDGNNTPKSGIFYDGCFNHIMAGIADTIGELMLSIAERGQDPNVEFYKFMTFLKRTVIETIKTAKDKDRGGGS